MGSFCSPIRRSEPWDYNDYNLEVVYQLGTFGVG
jgi:hypothetical protein